MTLDPNDEILKDFIVEAGEIIELLSSQLIELEKKPDDVNLLNDVFRGFHTIKGGAGFLSLDNLIKVCHSAENVFSILKNRQRKVDKTLMDVMLETMDTIGKMFNDVKECNEPESAEQSLLDKLESLSQPDLASKERINNKTAEAGNIASTQNNVKTNEFDKEKESNNDEITEEEFEALLDELHGKHIVKETKQGVKPVKEDITEGEFDELLDTLSPQKLAKDNQSVAGEAKVEQSNPERKEEITKEQPKVEQKAIKEEQSVEKSQANIKPEGHKELNKEEGNYYYNESKTKNSVIENTIRVDTNRLDGIMNMVGELVLVRNRLLKLRDNCKNDAVIKTIGSLDLITGDLQLAIMKTRMQPIKKVFNRFPRVVRELTNLLGKEVSLKISGEDTDLDKNLVDSLVDPLIHLIRNAIDHGIESKDVRKNLSKPIVGEIHLSAAQQGDHIIVSIEDDGAGIDPEELREFAVQLGYVDKKTASTFSVNECMELIFIPGFTTKGEISNISGRGIGMDVVKDRINKLNGRIEIFSTKGIGTKINIKLPLTLAILPTLMVVVGDNQFAFPLVNVNEIFDLDLDHTNVIDGQLLIMIRNKPMPLFYLQDWFVKDEKTVNKEEPQHVVVASIGGQKIGFVVDKLLGQEEVVIKPLTGALKKHKGIIGATISGNGNIAMILDVPNLLKVFSTKSNNSQIFCEFKEA